MYYSLTRKAVDFYKNKDSAPYYTTCLLKKYQQSSKGYIGFANYFVNNGEVAKELTSKNPDEVKWLNNYKKIKDLIEQNNLDEVYALRGLNPKFILDIQTDKTVGEPNQKWHFLVSYCAQCELDGTTANIFNRSIICPELWLWLIEDAKDDINITEDDVKKVYEQAIIYKAEGIKYKEKWKDFLDPYKEKVKKIVENNVESIDTYIVVRNILNRSIINQYYLKLNRKSSCLEIYSKTSTKALWSNYPIRKDFNASDYVMYELAYTMPCIFGGDGKTQTPAGIFNIEKVSSSEYISPYHPKFDLVKFFGYLVVFEDYFIHSDMYSMDVNIDDFREKGSISLHDKHTSGCIRVSQEDLSWLIKKIPEGTTIEM